MKNQFKFQDLAGQNKVNVKKSQKRHANLQQNSTLYFQLGLILCLLFSYGLLEMRFETNTYDIGEVIYDDLDDNIINVNPIIEQPVVKKKMVKSMPKRLIDQYKTEPDNVKKKAIEDVVVDLPKTAVPAAITDIPYIDPPVDVDNIPYDFVEVVPVFPGCERADSNNERKSCMSEKIANHIRRTFDTDIASNLGLEGVVLFLDLDMIIFENINKLFSYKPKPLKTRSNLLKRSLDNPS